MAFRSDCSQKPLLECSMQNADAGWALMLGSKGRCPQDFGGLGMRPIGFHAWCNQIACAKVTPFNTNGDGVCQPLPLLKPYPSSSTLASEPVLNTWRKHASAVRILSLIHI